ncbi:putative oxidoreductase [Helianthus debilis subsp. tardiflorus]
MFATTFLPLTLISLTLPSSSTTDICIIGSDIAHFFRQYSPTATTTIHIFEGHPVVGDRMATITIAGETFEVGTSIPHPKNYHALNFTNMLNLKVKGPFASDSSMCFGIWDGQTFLFKTIDSDSKSQIVQYVVSFVNSIQMLFRYGISLLKMNNFVEVLAWSVRERGRGIRSGGGGF